MSQNCARSKEMTLAIEKIQTPFMDQLFDGICIVKNSRFNPPSRRLDGDSKSDTPKHLSI
jgi:hypothetical protein